MVLQQRSEASEGSYSRGSSSWPLLEATIGEQLELAVAGFGDQEALVDVPSGRRWTYEALNEDVDQLALGLLSRGSWRGAHRHLGPELRGVDLTAVRMCQVRRGSGQYQPRLP